MWQDKGKKKKASCLGQNPANYNLPYLQETDWAEAAANFHRCWVTQHFEGTVVLKALQQDFILKNESKLLEKTEKNCYRCNIGQC